MEVDKDELPLKRHCRAPAMIDFVTDFSDLSYMKGFYEHYTKFYNYSWTGYIYSWLCGGV